MHTNTIRRSTFQTPVPGFILQHVSSALYYLWQGLWLRLGVNVDDQLWLRLSPIPIRNCNPSASPSPSRNTNPNPNRPTTLLLTLTDPLTSK